MYATYKGVSGHGKLLVFRYFDYSTVIANANNHVFAFVAAIRKIAAD